MTTQQRVMIRPEPTREGHAVPVDKVAVVKRALEAFADRDVRASLELADPEIELVVPGTASLAQGGRSYRGLDGLVRYVHDVGRIWDELEVIPQRYEERDDCVMVTGRLRARREGSFLIDEPAHWVFELCNGKVLRARAYTDRDAALTAFGIAKGKKLG
jgi:ketosteroid isomerase-like protein